MSYGEGQQLVGAGVEGEQVERDELGSRVSELAGLQVQDLLDAAVAVAAQAAAIGGKDEEQVELCGTAAHLGEQAGVQQAAGSPAERAFDGAQALGYERQSCGWHLGSAECGGAAQVALDGGLPLRAARVRARS